MKNGFFGGKKEKYYDVASVLKNNSSDKQLLNDFKGIKSTCDQCDFATTRLSDLKRHQKANHEGMTDNNIVDPVFIETSDMNVADTEIKKEEITEEDPLSDTITKKEIDTELMMFKKEPEDEDCDLETKI